MTSNHRRELTALALLPASIIGVGALFVGGSIAGNAILPGGGAVGDLSTNARPTAKQTDPTSAPRTASAWCRDCREGKP